MFVKVRQQYIISWGHDRNFVEIFLVFLLSNGFLLSLNTSVHGSFIAWVIQTEESFELRVQQEGVWELRLMFHAFYSMLVSIWVLNLNKFWMISFLEVLSFFRNFLGSIWLFYLLRVSYWFLFCEFFVDFVMFRVTYFSFYVLQQDIFDFFIFDITLCAVSQAGSIWESSILRLCVT